MSAAERRLVLRGASLEEAAAAIAAIERYVHDTAAPARSDAAPADRWQRAARLSAVGEADASGHWGDPHPWGR